MDDIEIVDCYEKPITIGTKCIYGAPNPDEVESQTVTVTEISDPDADYDDELGRGVEYPPRVKVIFPDGETYEVTTHNITQITWADYPDGPQVYRYQADDLEVLGG